MASWALSIFFKTFWRSACRTDIYYLVIGGIYQWNCLGLSVSLLGSLTMISICLIITGQFRLSSVSLVHLGNLWLSRHWTMSSKSLNVHSYCSTLSLNFNNFSFCSNHLFIILIWIICVSLASGLSILLVFLRLSIFNFTITLVSTLHCFILLALGLFSSTFSYFLRWNLRLFW